MDEKMEGEDALVVAVGFSIPLWQGKYRAARREAEARRDAAVAGVEDVRRRLQADLVDAVARHNEKVARIALYEDEQLPSARQAVEVITAAYRGGSVGILEVIDSQRTLIELQRTRWRAEADARKAAVEVEALTSGIR